MWHARSSLLAVTWTLALFSLTGVHAARALPRQATAGMISPEEAIINIKPLQLGMTDLPQGYGPGATTAATPVTETVRQSANGGDPYATLNQLQGEGTQACSVQSVTPPMASALMAATFTSCLMADAPSAHNVVMGSVRPVEANGGSVSSESMPAGFSLGDDVTTIARVTPATIMASGGSSSAANTAEFDVRWARGQVAFELRTRTAQSQQNVSESASLSQTVDTGESARPLAMIGTATVTPPASEEQRLYAALASQPALVTAAQVSTPTSQPYMHTLIHPAESVLTAANPTAALHTIDEVFHREIMTTSSFRTSDRRIVQGEILTIDADPGGTQQELRNTVNAAGVFNSPNDRDEYPGAMRTFTAQDAPVQLGDSTLAAMVVRSYPDSTRNYVTYRISWQHGPVLLQAFIGEPQSMTGFKLQDVVPWAQSIEKAYQASQLAAMVSPVPANVRAQRPLLATAMALWVEMPSGRLAAGRRRQRSVA